MIWPCSEAHLTQFSVIQTHLSRHFHVAVDFLGLRRNGSSSLVINQGQDFLEQAPWHRNLGQLEISAILQKLVEEEERFASDRSTKAYVSFAPVEWKEITAFNLTPTTEWTQSGRSLLFEFRNTPTRVNLALMMGPTSNEIIRDEVHSFCKSKTDIFRGLTD